MTEPVVLGRYMLCDVIGEGGMANVHIGKIVGAGGFSRVVAIKRLHPDSAADPQIAAMLIDEARLVSRIRHPNVVPTLDVVAVGDELLLVMEYVHGVALSQLVKLAQGWKEPVPLALAARIVIDVLAGLAAAHEARSERGTHLELVHRDVSPQNILIDVTGMARVVDFGIAKAAGKVSMTRQGQIKGKLNYMSPEQLRGDEGVDRRTDLYAAGVVLWELVCGRRLFDRQRKDLRHVVQIPADFRIDPPSEHRGSEAILLDRVIERALAHESKDRFADADAMATAITEAITPATAKDLAAYLLALADEQLEKRDAFIERAEQLSAIHDLPREEVIAARPIPSVSPPAMAPASSSRKKPPIILALVATVALGACVVLLFVWSRRDREPATDLFTAPAPLPVVDAGEEVVVAAELTAPATTAATARTPTPTRAKPRAPVRTAGPAPAPAPPPPHAPDCNPPYSVDARGVRIPRRECVGE